MDGRISRRSFLGAAAGVGALAALSGCAGLSPGTSQPMQVSSYGDQGKLKLRDEVVEKFNDEHKGAKLGFEGVASADYWDKLATQVAGGDAPDIINIDSVHIAQYGASGQLLPLDEFIPSTIHTDYFDKNLLIQGRLNGKLYGLPLSAAAYGMGFDATVLGELGIPEPDGSWTWDDYAALANEIHKAGAGKGLYGCADEGGDLPTLEIFLRGRGEELVNPANTKELGFSVDSLAAWYDFWEKLRHSGGCVPPDIGANFVYGDWPNSPIVTKKAVMEHIATSNLDGGFQSLTKDEIKLVLPPVATRSGKQGQFLVPSSLWALSAKTKDKKLGAQFLEWFNTNPSVAEILGFVSGPPASEKTLGVLESKPLSSSDAMVVNYMKIASKGSFTPPPPQPSAFVQIGQAGGLLTLTNQDIAFGKQKLPAAARSMYAHSAALLKQS